MPIGDQLGGNVCLLSSDLALLIERHLEAYVREDGNFDGVRLSRCHVPFSGLDNRINKENADNRGFRGSAFRMLPESSIAITASRGISCPTFASPYRGLNSPIMTAMPQRIRWIQCDGGGKPAFLIPSAQSNILAGRLLG
jgi:hypothetical protein